MYKLLAKLKLQGKNAGYLIKAFFQDFNPESKITIKGIEADLEIFFEKPPNQIINAISCCEISEFFFDNGSCEDETPKQSEEASSIEEAFDDTSISPAEEQTDIEQQADSSSNPSVKKNRPSKANTILQYRSASELDKLAGNSTSFSGFVKSVAEWLEMGKNQELFENLVFAAAELEEISWETLKQALAKREIVCSDYCKHLITKKISKKLKVSYLQLLPYLSAIVEFKDFPFEKEESLPTEESSDEPIAEEVSQPAEEISGEQAIADTIEPAEEISDEGKVSNSSVKMKCMPEIKNFEEALSQVDKAQPLEKRIRYVLNAMGLSSQSREAQKQILEIATVAIKNGITDFGRLFPETNIPSDETTHARMIFSTFLNDFVQKYESDKKVKVLTFLSELRTIIMLDSEM